MTRNIVSAITEDGETYAYIYLPEYSTEIKRLVVLDGIDDRLSLSLVDAHSICQRMVAMELREMENKEQATINVRWMIRRDMPAVVDIESRSFESAWVEEDFIQCLRNRSCVGMVAETEDYRIVGYMIYELAANRLELVNFAVDVDFRRQGIGSQMLQVLQKKLSRNRRTCLSLVIRESNLAGQLFFKANGFLATNVVPNYWDCGEGGYHMQFNYKESNSASAV